MPSASERFSVKFVPGDPFECWPWLAGISSSTGYGQFHPAKDEQCTAHSFMYRMAHGEVPSGHVIDHECHNLDAECEGGKTCPHRRCVNPTHLVLRTGKENLRRGPRFNGSKTHCPAGHKYTPENTAYQVKGSTISRKCIECRRIYDDRRRGSHAQLTHRDD